MVGGGADEFFLVAAEHVGHQVFHLRIEFLAHRPEFGEFCCGGFVISLHGQDDCLAGEAEGAELHFHVGLFGELVEDPGRETATDPSN